MKAFGFVSSCRACIMATVKQAKKQKFKTDHNQIFYVFMQSLFDGFHSAFILEVKFNPTTENKLTNVCKFSTVQTL